MPIYDGRYADGGKKPIGTTAPPIQLFHPVFGHFLDSLSNKFHVPDDFVKATVGYMQVSSAIYDTEADRSATLAPHLGRILGCAVGTVVNADGTHPDGALPIVLTNEICETVVTLLIEEKNNFGDAGCDPSIQVGLSMTRFWAQNQVDKHDSSLLSSTLIRFSISIKLYAITPVARRSSSQPLVLGSPSSALFLRTNGSSSVSQISSGLA